MKSFSHLRNMYNLAALKRVGTFKTTNLVNAKVLLGVNGNNHFKTGINKNFTENNKNSGASQSKVSNEISFKRINTVNLESKTKNPYKKYDVNNKKSAEVYTKGFNKTENSNDNEKKEYKEKKEKKETPGNVLAKPFIMKENKIEKDNIIERKSENKTKILSPTETKPTTQMTRITPYKPKLGNKVFGYYDQIRNDKDYLNFLFDMENSNELKSQLKDLETSKEGVRKEVYKMYIRYLQEKKLNIEDFLDWLDEQVFYKDKKYTISLLNYISETIKEEEVEIVDLARMVSISQELNYRNWTLLNMLEKKIVKHKDIVSFNFYNTIQTIFRSDWKTNDEFFGRYYTALIHSILPKLNYNNLVLILESITKFTHIGQSLWDYYEEDCTARLKALYKSKSIERMAEAFVHNNIATNHTKHEYMLKLIADVVDPKEKTGIITIGVIRSYALLAYSKNFSDEGLITYLKYISAKKKFASDSTELNFFVEFIYFIELSKGIVDKEYIKVNLLSKFEKFSKTLNGTELFSVLENMVKFNYFKYVKFPRDQLDIVKLVNAPYFRFFEFMHKFCAYEENLTKFFNYFTDDNFKNLTYYNPFDLQVAFGKYFQKFQIENKNKFYAHLKNIFLERLGKTTTIGEMKFYLLTLPLYKHLILNPNESKDKKIEVRVFDAIKSKNYYNTLENLVQIIKISTTEFVDKETKQIVKRIIPKSNFEDVLCLLILKNDDYFKEKSKRKQNEKIEEYIIDIDHESSKLIKMIKDYGDFSNKEMEQLYDYGNVRLKLFSSLYNPSMENL